jgi:hypothetical protein
VIKATFAGYLVDGGTGALIATAAGFLPVYLFVIIPDPLLGRHAEQPRPQGSSRARRRARSRARRS